MVSAITYCGQRLTSAMYDYTCTLAQDHRSEFHMDVQAMATWSSARDVVVHTDQRQAALRCDASDPDPKGTAALVDLLRQRGETIAKLRNAIARTGDCTCADVGEGNLDQDDLCPRHGIVAQLIGQVGAHAKHAKNAEDALARIAGLARQALDTVGSGTPHPLITFQQAMGRIIAVTEEKDR